MTLVPDRGPHRPRACHYDDNLLPIRKLPQSGACGKDIRRHGARNRPAGSERFTVEGVDQANRGAERAFHPRNQIVDQRLIHDELTVGEELYQHLAQKLVFRRAKEDWRRQSQARAKIRQTDTPILRLASRRQEQRA